MLIFKSFKSKKIISSDNKCKCKCKNGKNGKDGKNGSSFIPTNELNCSIGNIGDTILDLNNCNLYTKQNGSTVFPVPPRIKPIPIFNCRTIPVGTGQNFTTIQSALLFANAGDTILLNANETFTVTSTIILNKSVAIVGQTGTIIQMSAPPVSGNPFVFDVIANDGTFLFQNFEVKMNYPSVTSIETILSISSLTLTDVFVDNVRFGVNEFAISSRADSIQVTNCYFYYASPSLVANNFRYLYFVNITGQYIIANNVFETGGQSNTATTFVIITNVFFSGGQLTGSLSLLNNTQIAGTFSLRHLLLIEEWIGSNFKLFIDGNQTIDESNAPILFSSPDNNIFDYIVLTNNTFQNTAGKGVIGVFTQFGATQGTTNIYALGNTIVNETFTTGWVTATNPSSIFAGWDELQGTNPLYTLFSTTCLKLIGNLDCEDEQHPIVPCENPLPVFGMWYGARNITTVNQFNTLPFNVNTINNGLGWDGNNITILSDGIYHIIVNFSNARQVSANAVVLAIRINGSPNSGTTFTNRGVASENFTGTVQLIKQCSANDLIDVVSLGGQFISPTSPEGVEEYITITIQKIN